MTSQKEKHEKDAKRITLAVLFFALGCFFRFVLIGYQTIALICWGIGGLILLLSYLPWRWMRRLIAGVTLVGVLCLCLIEIPIINASHGDSNTDAEYLIVLGAGVNGREPSLSLYHRLVAAETWLKEHPDSIAVLSGGQGPKEEISEAACMYQWLVDNGIAAERLYKEEASTTTRENLLFSKQLIEEQGLHPVIAIATSEYHEYRAGMIADALDITWAAVPGKTAIWLFPTYYVRELYGILYEWIF